MLELSSDHIGALRRPEGTFEFRATVPRLLDPAVPGGVLLDVVAGLHVFRLVRNDSLRLSFVHASPGTGTRVALLDLHALECSSDGFFFVLVWSPEEIRLHVGCHPPQGRLGEAVGVRAPFELQIGRDGVVYQVGSRGVEVAGLRMHAGGVLMVAPSAINLWADTRLAAETLLAGAGDDYFRQVVTSNAVLSGLTTGFETYCQQRFVELEGEGVPCDVIAVARTCLSRQEKLALDESGLRPLEQEAADNGLSVVAFLAGRLSFQNYKKVKEAFSRGYRLKLGDLMSSTLLERIQRLLDYRHRVVHVSPVIGLLNQDRVPPEEPVFSNSAFAHAAVASFDEFIGALHAGTLRLRPPPA